MLNRFTSSLVARRSSLLSLAPAILFSWFAILSLFATNIHGTTINQVIEPLLFTTFVVVVIQIGLAFLTKKPTFAALISLTLVVTFFSFNSLTVIFGQWLEADQAKVAVWLLYILVAIVLVVMAMKSAGRQTTWPSIRFIKLISLVGIILLVGPLIQIVPGLFASSEARQQALQATQVLPVAHHSSLVAASQPDIYYIVLDRYASPKTQAEYYDYDNQQLIDYLAQKQFYLATDSNTNYPKTLFSLSSTLNLDYLQSLVDTQADGVSDTDTASVLMRNHKAGQIFKSLGYTYFHVGNYYELASNIEVADTNIMANWSDFITTSSFTRQLLETSYYPELAGLTTNYPLGLGFDQHYRWADFGQQQLLQATKQTGQKFVMTHLLMPHDPYVYDADCNLLQQPLQRWEISPANYIEQVKCANSRAMQAIDTILANSTQPPIIILQSDEGPEAMISPTGHHWKFDGASDTAIQERTQILNAYYFPDQNYSQLYPTITPVNSFRTVFRQYFNYDLPNLEDQTYLWPDKDHLFDFYLAP